MSAPPTPQGGTPKGGGGRTSIRGIADLGTVCAVTFREEARVSLSH